MTTIELSRAAARPNEAIGLVIDDKTLRKNLRFAFSNYYTVVQELLQNARRAGADKIDVQYEIDTKRLIVSDNGCGLKDFSVLLRFAASGWSADVAAEEMPYGLGFMAAIYAANDVLVVSGERQLRFNSAALLDGATFPIKAAAVPVKGTRLELDGLALDNPDQLLDRIARGYSVPITFNGRVLPRTHALDEATRTFEKTAVGWISIPPTNPSPHLHIYLQGFQVYKDTAHWPDLSKATVVHLDSTKWRGRFPDRDRVIDEEIMLVAVKQAIREMLEARLVALKASLPPAEFCWVAYDLAKTLSRLDVFNDVDFAPEAWFGMLASLPYAPCSSESCFDDAAPEGTTFTRAQFESGELIAAELDELEFPEWCSHYDEPDTTPQLAWMLAYRLGAKVLTSTLDDGHWLYGLIRFNSECGITLEVVGCGKAAEMPMDRTNRIGGIRIQLCDATVLKHDGLSVVVEEPWIGKTPGAEPTLFVPSGSFVEEYTLRQFDSYVSDEELQEDELSDDVREVNQFLRELATDEPKERLQLALRAALDDYRSSVAVFDTFSVSVDDRGVVTVTDVVQRARPASPLAP